MMHKKSNTDNLKLNDPVYISDTNAVGFIIDGGYGEDWGDTRRTDTDGIRSFNNLHPFTFSDLQTPEVYVPTSFIHRLGMVEKVKRELSELYGEHAPDRVFEEPISKRDVLRNEERLPCGLLVRHRVKREYHGFQILQEAETRAAVLVRNSINNNLRYTATVGVTEQGKTIVFLSRYYGNDGKVYGRYETLTEDSSGFYLAGYGYDEEALKELGWTYSQQEGIEDKVKAFVNNYHKTEQISHG